MIFGVCCLIILVGSCRGKPDESVVQVADGSFKILVRSQEFHKSGIRNVDVCVAAVSVAGFPKDKAQCFLHGFDFSGLSAKWRSHNEIEVSFSSGRVTSFANTAFVSSKGPIPAEFYVTLCDGCSTGGTHIPGFDRP